jgi:hypothetical protein
VVHTFIHGGVEARERVAPVNAAGGLDVTEAPLALPSLQTHAFRVGQTCFAPNALAANKEKSFHETKKLGLDQDTAIELAQVPVRGERRIDLKDGASSPQLFIINHISV